MTIKTLWDSYHFYTRTLSEESRKLAFAAAAVCWFFKSDDVTFPALIVSALLGIVLFFLFDILQYLTRALLIRSWTYRQEARLEFEKGTALPDDDVPNPPRLDKAAFFFLCIKLFVLLLAFSFMIAEFIRRLLI